MLHRRILVTGGAGFIGSHLVRRLVAAGHRVDVLHRPDGDLHRLKDLADAICRWPCDLLDRPRLRELLGEARPEVVYHLAGDTSLRRADAALAGVEESLDRNVRGSMNLVLAANEAAPLLSVLIRLGGLEEYGRGPLPYRESQREEPVSPYSASQVAVTHYLRMLAPHLSYRTVTVRPALVYGPAQSKSFFVPALIDHCLEGRDFEIRSPHHGRDLLYIDDLVDLLVQLLETRLATGEVLNAGSGREYLMSEVATAVIRLSGAPIRLLTDGSRPPGDVPHLYGSAEKARALLGWQPLVELEEGLERTIRFFRGQR